MDEGRQDLAVRIHFRLNSTGNLQNALRGIDLAQLSAKHNAVNNYRHGEPR